MADEIITPVAPVAVQPAETATPAVAVPDSAGSPSVESPAAAPAAPAVDPAAAPAAAPAAEPATVLGAPDTAAEPAKTPDAPVAPVEVKKEEAPQSAEPAPLPTYEAFTLPEGVSFEGEKLSEFTKELGEFQNLTKADQSEMQKFGQKLLDRHLAGIQETIKGLEDHQNSLWKKQTGDWKAVLDKDPEIGGNRLATVTKDIVDAISTTSSKEAHNAFRHYMEETGIGNNPDLIRPIYNMAKEISNLRAQLKAYESEDGVKPLPGTKPAATATSKVARRYGSSN